MPTCPNCGHAFSDSESLSALLLDDDLLRQLRSRIRMSRQSSVLFMTLWQQLGVIVAESSLFTALSLNGQKDMSLDALRSAKRNLVNALKGYPVSIEAARGLGYRMVVTDPKGWDWRALPLLNSQNVAAKIRADDFHFKET